MRASRALALALLLPALAVPGAHAADETCHGHPATIVGTPDAPLDGTDSDDVIVTNGATYTDAKAGDDLICVTGGSEPYDDPSVAAGPGNDLVDTTATTAVRVHTYLGEGDDIFTGGDRPDDVSANDPFEAPHAQGHDSISTAGGADLVSTGGGVTPDTDDIDLGDGNDDAWLQGSVDPDHVFVGGNGSDQVEFDRDTLRTTLVIDNVAGQATSDGSAKVAWVAFERFRITPIGHWEPPSFVGGPGPEKVWSAIPLTAVHLGSGDDRLDLELQRGRSVDDVSYAGGAGDDDFVLYAGAGDRARREVLDLSTHRLRFAIHHDLVHARISGFERHRLSSDRLWVRGTPGDDRIEWFGCRGRVNGGAGDDVIQTLDIDDVACGYENEDRTIVAYGNAGDDVLAGAFGHDILRGGPGRDAADGASGQDRCVAEVVRRCES